MVNGPINIENYNKVLKLRKFGDSFNLISKKLRIPKSTISYWLSGNKLSESIKLQLIQKNKIRSSNYLTKVNAFKHSIALKRHESYRKEAQLEFIKLRKNKLFLTGLAIYWGEGEKTESGRVSVVNSDTEMLKVMINFYRKILKIQEEKLRAALFIYKDIKEKDAIAFWAKALKISTNSFIKTQILPSRSKLTKSRVAYGMCNIYFSNTKINVKIREWVSLLAKEMRD
ncbi:MAG: hypothetical protein ACOYUB_03525 [Patescibacteria group bacterium]